MPEFRDTTYAQGSGYWKAGDGRPPIVFDGPAAANAAGRCVANRVRYGSLPGIPAGSIHPAKCGWCDYPKDKLLAALDHATWRSQFVESEFAVWRFGNANYRRTTGRSGEYDHSDWRAFFRGATPSTENLPPSEREHHRTLRSDAIAHAADRKAAA
jgi:hypothetical protein